MQIDKTKFLYRGNSNRLLWNRGIHFHTTHFIMFNDILIHDFDDNVAIEFPKVYSEHFMIKLAELTRISKKATTSKNWIYTCVYMNVITGLKY